MGLIECPDCDGKVSDIAPSCPHCGRPFENITKEPVRLTTPWNPAQQVPGGGPIHPEGFKNSATENVFKLIWNWIQFQAWLWKFLVSLPLCYIGIMAVCMLLAAVIYPNGMDYLGYEGSETSKWAYIVHIFAIICAGFIAWHHEKINNFSDLPKLFNSLRTRLWGKD